MSRRLGDRVGHWITHNEPWCVSLLSHHLGIHAPGLTDLATALRVAHHVLLSHGDAVPVIRANARRGAEVGITLNFEATTPASPSVADCDAARHADGAFNRWFLDPVFGRRYPADIVHDYEQAGALSPGGGDWIRPGDPERIAAPLDFLGVNYYTRRIVRSASVPESENEPRSVFPPPASDLTTMGWEVYPDGLRDLLCRVHFGTGHRRSTSPRTDPRTRTSSGRTARSATRAASRTCVTTSARARAPLPPGCPSPATSPGRCSTTSSGSAATPSASASSTSTTPPRSAPPKDTARYYAGVIEANRGR